MQDAITNPIGSQSLGSVSGFVFVISTKILGLVIYAIWLHHTAVYLQYVR